LDRNAKVQWREDVVEVLNKSSAIFLANYAGMTVENLTFLRRELKNVQADFHVVKNTVAKKAFEGRDEAVVVHLLKGQTGVVFARGDVAAAAKALNEAVKKFEQLKLLGGCMGNSFLSPASVEVLASLPPRPVLIGQIVGSLVAPHRGLLGVMSGVPRKFVQLLNAIKEQKSS